MPTDENLYFQAGDVLVGPLVQGQLVIFDSQELGVIGWPDYGDRA
jgi:hypothetical protein